MWYVRIFPPLSRGCSSSVLSHRTRIRARQRVWSGHTPAPAEESVSAPNGFHGRGSIRSAHRGIKRHAEFEAPQPNPHRHQLSVATRASLGPADLLHDRDHQLVQLSVHLLPAE